VLTNIFLSVECAPHLKGTRLSRQRQSLTKQVFEDVLVE